MPIRMEEDDPRDQYKPKPQPQPGEQSSGSGFMKWIPFVLLFVFRKPKLLIPLLLVAAAWYFFFGGSQTIQNMLNPQVADTNSYPEFTLGASFDQAKYDKVDTYEPLTSYGNYNQIPASSSLLQFAPRRLQQGRQGSCVGWASAYGARTILHARATGKDPNSLVFSPSYLYNQIALEGCQGAYMEDAMKTMYENGAVPFNQFGYDERTCSRAPSGSLVTQGRQYRIKGYTRLTTGANDPTPDINGIRQHLAQGGPVVIGMMVGGTFMSRMVGQRVWYPTQRDYGMQGFGGHAMCVIGYDDRYEGGAFQIMNSWGPDWGDNGIGWVRYKDFQFFNKEAYGLYPMGAANNADANRLQAEFGLLDIAAKQTLPLAKDGEITFRTIQPIKKGDKFKVLIANSIECYIYVFGQETDGSSYVLFPYTDKHSPYCGITGTRLFPNDFSLVADNVGNRDYIAVVVSKKELDYNALNRALNSSKQTTYEAKLKEALGGKRMTQAAFQAGKTISLDANSKEQAAVGMVIAFDKK